MNFNQNNELKSLLEELRNKLSLLFGEKLEEIILYGSYARGDFDNESDIDILVIIKDDNLRNYNSHLSKIELELFKKYNLLVSLIPETKNYFKEHSNNLPFFKIINEEGIRVYG